MYKWLYISVQLSILSCYNYLRSEIICISVCFCQLRMGTERVTAWRAAGRQLHDITNTSRLRARSSLLPDPRTRPHSHCSRSVSCLQPTACLSRLWSGNKGRARRATYYLRIKLIILL